MPVPPALPETSDDTASGWYRTRALVRVPSAPGEPDRYREVSAWAYATPPPEPRPVAKA